MKNRLSLPSSRDMYNYDQAQRTRIFMRISEKADDYNERMVSDIPDDYPDKAKLAEMYTYEYFVEQKVELSKDQHNRYIQLLCELNYIGEVEAAERMMADQHIESASRQAAVIGGLAVEFVD